jgi:TonB family protein
LWYTTYDDHRYQLLSTSSPSVSPAKPPPVSPANTPPPLAFKGFQLANVTELGMVLSTGLSPSATTSISSPVYYIAWQIDFTNRSHMTKTELYRVDANLLGPDRNEIATSENEQTVDKSSERPIFNGQFKNTGGNVFPAGNYSVSFSLNGHPVTTKQFTVSPEISDLQLQRDPYIAAVQKKIRQRWTFSGSNPYLSATVSFRVDPSGKVDTVTIVHSSNDRFFDDSVVRAIKGAAPFAQPPEEYRAELWYTGITTDFESGGVKNPADNPGPAPVAGANPEGESGPDGP